MQVKSISFKGQIIENPVLDKCLKRFTPTYLKEYQELKTIAESSYDRHVFVPYERTEAYKENKQLCYKYYVGVRHNIIRKIYGEEFVGKSTPQGTIFMNKGYIDAILKPLRKIYMDSKIEKK